MSTVLNVKSVISGSYTLSGVPLTSTFINSIDKKTEIVDVSDPTMTTITPKISINSISNLDSYFNKHISMGGFKFTNLKSSKLGALLCTKKTADVDGFATVNNLLGIDKSLIFTPVVPTTIPVANITVPLSLNGFKFIELGDPVGVNSAVSKSYADRMLKTEISPRNISMGGNYVTNIGNPTASGDAATKGYLDSIISSGKVFIKNITGLIPPIVPGVKLSPFLVTASSTLTETAAENVTHSYTNGTWRTNGVYNNFRLNIALPVPVAIWSVLMIGLNTNVERIYRWRIEGSNDNGVTWTSVYAPSVDEYIGSTPKYYSFPNKTKYSMYSLYCINAEPTNPGLSYFQMYPLSEIV